MKLNKLARYCLIIAIIFGSFGVFSGCKKSDETTEKSEQREVYELYVQYMSDKGETPLTYEQWLDSIKGDKGNPGENGITPNLRINETTNEWEISMDGGLNWTSTGVKATGENGKDASYVEYRVTFDYKGLEAVFQNVIEHTTVKSTQWIKDLPKVKEKYENVFLGWFIKGTSKQINNYDFIGEDIELEARFSKNNNEVIDTVAPVITLIGEEIIYLEVGEEYEEMGATAIDAEEGDISNKIVITGSINENEIGTYYIHYDVVDSSGNIATRKTRTIIVEDAELSSIYIRLISGNSNQVLGLESKLIYQVTFPNTITSGATIQWLIDGTEVETNEMNLVYFEYIPNLGLGTHTVQAKIGGKTSDKLFFCVSNNNQPVITLNGNPVVYIEAKAGVDYIEQGATVMDDIDGDLTDTKLVITGNVNAEAIGIYFIKYDAVDSHGNHAESIYRQVIVRDTTAPTITLNGDSEIVLNSNQSYEELGATAIDSYDGEVEVTIDNSELKSAPGKYAIYYTARDASGNISSIVRYVTVVDKVAPVITLTGEEIIYLEVGEEYEEMGATAIDAEEGDISNKIVITGSVNENELGIYYINYDVQDEAGNIATRVVRTVLVRDTTEPEITLKGSDEIVLTYGESYEELGATAIDSYDGEVEVVVDNSQLKNEAGSYVIYYTAMDESGNVSYITRTVTISRKRIIVRPMEMTKVYGEKDPEEFSYDVEGELVDDIDFYGALSREEGENVGMYRLTLGTLSLGNNYEIELLYASLEIVQREVFIEVKAGQSKQYGDNDPKLEFVVYYNGVEEEMFEHDYVGGFGREPGEEPGEYAINLGTFELMLNGRNELGETVSNYRIIEFADFPTFHIEKRTILVKARNVSAFYGNEYQQDIIYDTSGSKLAYNLTLEIDGQPIHDVLSGELKILGNVDGIGAYTISCEDIKIVRSYTGEDVTHKYYNYTYENGTLTIKPREIKIKVDDGQFKKYGEDDPYITFKYTPELLDDGDEFIGTLNRTPRDINGNSVTEDVGQYYINLGTLSVKTPSGKPNYKLTIDGTPVFTIISRSLILKADDIEIYYGDPFELTYTISGDGLANNPGLGVVDTVEGELNLDREYSGYGTYRILGDHVTVTNVRNYNYSFLPGEFTIRYAEFTGITIYTLTGNQYQLKGEEEEVRLYARFNEGADETNIGDVEWAIVKNEELDWEFTNNPIDNIISFLPSGSVGTYVVSASYGGKIAYYEVYVGTQL